MKLTRLKTAALAAGLTTMLASTALAADVKATMIIYLDPSVQFFNPVVKGAQDAAAAFGVDLDVQYANNDPVRQNDLIESATAMPSRRASSSSASTTTTSKAPRAIAARPMSAWTSLPRVTSSATG